MKKICFIAQFPPPIHGLSKAVDTLYNSRLYKEFEFEKIDITNNKKFLKNMFLLYKSKADLFYFTISQTKGGNLRDLVILKLLRLQHKKCLVHLHGGYYRNLIDNDLPKWQKKANYKAINELSGVIVLGESLKHIFEGMIDESKIYVVPNCIDDEYLMKESEFNNKIEKIENKKIKQVLYLSNFIKEKGYAEVLKLAKIEKQEFEKTQIRKLHFNFAGRFFNDIDKQDFLEYIQNNGLQHYITYYGVVTGEEKNKLLKENDIFILLTTYKKEGQPISILEAMGNGMAIVTTNHAGIPDIVKNEQNGIVVDKNRIKVEEIYKRLTNIKNKENMTKNYEIAKKYSQRNYIENMRKVFEELL